jgi:hypothetical protein
MSLQKIIDSAQQITIDKSPPVAVTMSRGQYLKTAERGARIWAFTVSPSQGWRWEQYRDEVEDLVKQDRITEEEINFGTSNTNLSWLTEYRGSLTTNQQGGLRTVSQTGNSMVLQALVSISAGTVCFKKGDLIQPTGHRYPYSITTDVVMPEAGNITVPIHRAFIGTVSGGTTLKLGKAVTWRVKMTKFPRYAITPGRIINWEDDFELTEVLQ